MHSRRLSIQEINHVFSQRFGKLWSQESSTVSSTCITIQVKCSLPEAWFDDVAKVIDGLKESGAIHERFILSRQMIQSTSDDMILRFHIPLEKINNANRHIQKKTLLKEVNEEKSLTTGRASQAKSRQQPSVLLPPADQAKLNPIPARNSSFIADEKARDLEQPPVLFHDPMTHEMTLRVPHAIMKYAGNCWETSLEMLDQFHHRSSISQHPHLYYFQVGGVYEQDFSEIANKRGFHTKKITLGSAKEVYQHLLDQGPFTINTNYFGFEHVVVITGIKNGKIIFNNPLPKDGIISNKKYDPYYEVDFSIFKSTIQEDYPIAYFPSALSFILPTNTVAANPAPAPEPEEKLLTLPKPHSTQTVSLTLPDKNQYSRLEEKSPEQVFTISAIGTNTKSLFANSGRIDEMNEIKLSEGVKTSSSDFKIDAIPSAIKNEIEALRVNLDNEIKSTHGSCFSFFLSYKATTKQEKYDYLTSMLEAKNLTELRDMANLAKTKDPVTHGVSSRVKNLVNAIINSPASIIFSKLT